MSKEKNTFNLVEAEKEAGELARTIVRNNNKIQELKIEIENKAINNQNLHQQLFELENLIEEHKNK